MFKKKPSLPARPMPPSFTLIQEDITEAPADDVVFKLNPAEILHTGNPKRKLPGDSKELHENYLDSENDEDSDSDPDILYNKVKTFVEVNNSLKTSITSFHEWYGALLRNGQALQNQTEEVKEQIAKALQEQNIENHKLFIQKPDVTSRSD